MAANALIGYRNWFESGTLTAGAAESARPVTDLATASGGDYWQTPAGTTTNWFRLDAGSILEWHVVGLFRTNLTGFAEWRIRLGFAAGDGSAYDSGQVSAGVQSGYCQALHVMPGTVSARWLHVDIFDPGNADAFLRVSLAFGGPAWQPARNFSYGSSVGWEDPTEMDETIGGQEFARLGPPVRRVLELAFDLVDEDSLHGTVLEIDRVKGRTGNVLAVPRPDQATAVLNREAVYGRLADNPRPSNPQFQLWAKRYRVRERL